MVDYYDLWEQLDPVILVVSIMLFVVFAISLIINYFVNKKKNYNWILITLIFPIITCSLLFKKEINSYTENKITHKTPEKFLLCYDPYLEEIFTFRDNNGNQYGETFSTEEHNRPIELYIEEGYSFIAFVENSHSANYKLQALSNFGTYEIFQKSDISQGKLIDETPKTGSVNFFDVIYFTYSLGELAYDSYNKTINVTCYSNASATKLNDEYQPSYFYQEGELIKKDSYNFSEHQTVLKVTQNLNTIYLVK